ncbi:hypothetical protein NQ176_g1395 [Zarea fungicola]|uniref:Uncharacterized protein n=1 Tax=Zarea fungicola TaxID=93591 RepID=A0ACC1NT08_9HYPO|nr:hypothetical protein NQ176_g1395 [Lecanicillium fungicola]
MKLVSVHSGKVVDLPNVALPPYAVLSHTHAATDQISSTVSNEKLAHAYERTIFYGLEYIWIAELCIDGSSMVDLDDAVNGSRRRLRDSTVCFAYLDDLPAEATLDSSALWSRCRYWKRAWTLQELILSPRIQFYDCKWNYRGDKDSPELLSLLSCITNIPQRVLIDSTTLSEISLGMQISWLAGRGAEREEDTAYALVAITKSTLPINYGEGATKAFLRLQEELLRDTRDGSLLAWQSDQEGDVRGLLARSPSEFNHFAPAAAASKELQRPWDFDGKVRLTSKGIELKSRVCDGPGSLLVSIGQRKQDLGKGDNIFICLRERNGIYVRVAAASYVSSAAPCNWHTITAARDLAQNCSLSLRSIFNSTPYRLDIADGRGYAACWQEGLGSLDSKDYAESIRLNYDQDTEMKLEPDEIMVACTTQSYTPSHIPDFSHVDIDLTGPWAGPQEQRQKRLSQHRSINEDAASDVDDAVSSVNSEMGRCTSYSECSSGCSSGCSSDCASHIDPEGDNMYGYQGYLYRNRAIGQPENDCDVDDETVATETRSTTTLTAEKDDWNSLKNPIMQKSFREKVLQTAYERLCHWITTVQYIEPPEDRLPPRSRINTSAWFARPESLTPRTGSAFSDFDTMQQQQQQQQSFVAIFRPHGYFHLACPFFAADPLLHPSCVVKGQDLQSISDVLRHVSQHHAWLPYCSRCYRDFEHAEDRDKQMKEARFWPDLALAGRLIGFATRNGAMVARGRRTNNSAKIRKIRNESDRRQRWINTLTLHFDSVQGVSL